MYRCSLSDDFVNYLMAERYSYLPVTVPMILDQIPAN